MGLFGLFGKAKKETLNKGLEKTKESVFKKLARAIVGKSKVDEEVLDNLEEVLISSDVGVDTTVRIIERIEARVERDKYMGVDELNRVLREEIAALLKENEVNDGSSFDLPDNGQPYVIMVVGVNGVGKTTTLKLILGLLPIEKGSICLGSYSLALHPLQYKKQISYVSDSHDIYNNLSGKEYLNFIADMYEVPSKTRGEIYTPLIEAFQVEKYLNSPIKKLSHGTKQKIAIIASLVNDPLLWVLDEPMTGLDVEAVHVLKKLIKGS